MSTTFRDKKTEEEEEEEEKEEKEEIFNPFKEEFIEEKTVSNKEISNPFEEEEEEEIFNPFEEEVNYQPEIDKLLTLYQKGFIDKDMVDLASKILGIELDLVDFKQIGNNLVRMPIIIIAKPSYFGRIKQQIPEADIADPYSKKYPIISLLSLEKTINTLANAKMPWKRFSIVIDSSYTTDIPQSAVALLTGLLDILRKAGYNVKLYTKYGEEPITLDEESASRFVSMENLVWPRSCAMLRKYKVLIRHATIPGGGSIICGVVLRRT
ncbi:structural protein [Acidianus two-tailed virus 2]|nr:structural protein [Acidianus two-tailed virus 2]